MTPVEDKESSGRKLSLRDMPIPLEGLIAE